MHGRISAANANSQQLGDFFRDGQQARHGLEGASHKIRVEAGDNHSLAEIGHFGANIEQAFAEKLAFVDADNFGARLHFFKNIFGGANQIGSKLESRVRDDPASRVALIDDGLENLHALPRDFSPPQPSN